MQFRKKILMLSLAAILLLTGCGGGPSAVEGAEPSSAPQVTVPDLQDTQSPQEPQELEPVPEVLSWDKTMQMVNADTILAKSKDGGFAILNNDGTVRASLPEYSSLTLKTPYCFIGSSGGKMDLLDVSGNVIVENVKDVHRKAQTKDDPWGILQYTAVESQEFGEKATTYFMRTDTFENIMEPTGDQTFLQFYFDGIQYLVSMPEADPMTADWFTLGGTPITPFTNLTAAPQYVDVSILDNAPYIYRIEDKKSHYLHRESAVDGRFEIHGLALLKYSEDIYEGDSNVQFGLMDLSGKKITDIKYQWSETNNCGVLATTPDRKTDVYDANGNFCFSSDSPISFLSKTFSHFSILKTPVVNKTQLGIYDFETKKFIFTTDASINISEISEVYGTPSIAHYLNVTAMYWEGANGLHTLLCANGTLIENVRPITENKQSSCGHLLMQSTTEPDKVMIINVETGEITSEFQARLS